MSKRAARRNRARIAQVAPGRPAAPKPPHLNVDPFLAAVARSQAKREAIDPFKPAAHPPSARPAANMAMDDAFAGTGSVGAWAGEAIGSYYGACGAFPGFAQLALQAQIPEIRRMVEIIASEATRKFIKVQASGEEKAEKVKAIETALDEFRVRDHFRRVLEGDGYFGRGHLFVDLGDATDDELISPIGSGSDATSAGKVTKGRLRGFKIVEALWTYPAAYGTSDPLADDWYRPQTWLVQGRRVHRTRLLTFVGREVPDLLKPAYSFGGLSLSQLAKPTVDNWLRTRQSVSDLVNAFSIMVFATRMANELGVMNPAVIDRVNLFNDLRSNYGTMLLDKESEALENIAVPLGTLDALQAQSQEHMASVSGIPLVKFFGNTPSGLNASSDGEIRVFYDTIHAYAELGRPMLTAILGFIQLHLFGAVDPEITFAFEPLWTMSEAERATARLTEAQTAQVYVDSGVLLPSEERTRLADDPESAYHGLDPDAVPDPTLGEEEDGSIPDAPEPEAVAEEPSAREAA